ncbi:MAG: S-formylglutathione hydrolase [Proteobacteria bacterium]|nr:MAG: S-formylglutathione hydrolase [Pseudomonadota bacterium]
MKVLKSHKSFEGEVRFWEHDSKVTGTPMKFSTFTPPGELKGALIWLSGLTCTDENFITKAGAQKSLAENGLMLICPDTSPRGLSLPAEHDSYDFGSGAGFYVNATTAGYKDHYRMYDYVANEIPQILRDHFAAEDKISISGHSMGGHGALIIGLREKNKFKSISAFSPIANPVKSAWGHKAFTGYLGSDENSWKEFDATELIAAGKSHPLTILIDQGSADEFLEKQLMPQNFETACKAKNQAYELRLREGYDHSYYFIASFIQSHIEFHAKALLAR